MIILFTVGYRIMAPVSWVAGLQYQQIEKRITVLLDQKSRTFQVQLSNKTVRGTKDAAGDETASPNSTTQFNG